MSHSSPTLPHSQACRWCGAALAAVIFLTVAPLAMAHPEHWIYGESGYAMGAVHPLTGADHLLAILCSGLLAVRIGTRRALWVIPLSFVGLMWVGGGLAYAGVSMPAAEWGIALSVIVLGLMVAMMRSTPLWLAATLVGAFALCHGHAHVAEMGAHPALAFMVGFSATTLALHAAAIALGLWLTRFHRPLLIRYAGAGMAIIFIGMLLLGH